MASEWSAEALVSSLGRTGHRERLRRKISSGSSTSEELEDRVRGTLNGLKIRLRGERLKYVKSQLEKNCLTLEQQLREVERLSRLRHNHHQLGSSAVTSSADASGGQTLDDNRGLILRNHFVLSPENSRQHHCQGPNRRPQICSKLNPGNSNARKIVFVDIARLEAVSRLPSYTAWMFVDRNERMTKDQSIARRRRISYETNGKETFFCLDAEEEAAANDGVETTKETRSLTASEEFVSRVAISEHGSGSAVLEIVADFVKVSVATVESLCQSLHAARFENNNNENRGWQPAASILSVSQVFPQPIHYGLGCHMKSNGDLHQDDEHLVQKVIPKPAQANAAENGYANVKRRSNKEEGEEQSEMPTTLALALDSFDTLFCRRCLIFNCALHDCVEEIVVGANEIQPPSRTLEQDPVKPCSLACHFLVSSPTVLSPSPAGVTAVTKPVCTSRCEFQRSSHMSCTSEIYKGGCCLRGGSGTVRRVGHINGQLREGDGDADDIDNEQLLLEFIETAALDVSTVDEGRFKSHEQKRRLLILKENRVKKSKKNAKKILADEVQTDSGEEEAIVHVKYGTMEDAESSSDLVLYRNEHAILNVPPLLTGDFTSFRSTNEGNDNITTTMENQDGKRGRTSDYWCSANRNISEKRLKGQPPTELANNRWNILEQDLCEKGIQIFGKNSCLIAQNILKGCKSCQEIYEYINKQEKTTTNARLSGDESSSTACVLSNTENELRSMELRSMEMLFHTGRVYRPPKFRFGRKKIAPKIALRPIQKRIGSGEGSAGVQNTLYPHYTPCSCESRAGCGRECPCALRNMHCEKYCGCFKVCKNRFRGCQCAKSMCDRRNCPCFAAGRECDPDVCKFCRIDCGHGHISSGECNNMRILFRKKKRLLLAQSDVCTGWGVFTRHPLGKNEYVGEYTGELILHSEADRRGRIYDQETSFLFNLNEKLVVDAFRKGNKLKFANHSSIRANCYAKVVLVGGDHRVGIFAKYKIQAGEELLYDYQYEPEIAPLWATTLS